MGFSAFTIFSSSTAMILQQGKEQQYSKVFCLLSRLDQIVRLRFKRAQQRARRFFSGLCIDAAVSPSLILRAVIQIVTRLLRLSPPITDSRVISVLRSGPEVRRISRPELSTVRLLSTPRASIQEIVSCYCERF
jgi:hypothetical protein